MSKLSKTVYFIFALTFFVFFDIYFSNTIIQSRFSIPDNVVFDLIYVQNTGAAFSIFENYPLFLIIFAVAAIFIILFYGYRNINKFSAFAMFWGAMLLSGIGCNLFERINYGYVRDFIMLKFVDFPVFNISDIFITSGVTALVILIIKNKYLRNEHNNR